MSAVEHSVEQSEGTGRLVLVGTPIGNLGDASPRMREAILAADLVAAEDTRRFRALCDRLELSPSATVRSVHDHNEADRARELADAVAAGRTVVLLSDAGMPAVSDPGYRVVKEVAGRGLDVTSVPGASAAVTALAVSGLPSDRWAFEGFLPRKPGERRRLLAQLAPERRTLVFYESPHRVGDALADMVAACGADRPAVVARELTKLHEEVLRGTLGELAQAAADGLRGEICIVLGPAAAQEAPGPEAVVGEVARLTSDGVRAKDAAARVAAAHGLRTREVYEAYLHAE
ncbi:16S rRNA (cytidine(1402)-2'-O)-methyltransferase [Brevibacterium yomogidense]|uniref:Ribosomal RNA small subunit methyltransferase I n=1 Tax=Brevibacterium yomogidense TaxID=946573 RepID=A0A1X6X9A6_9MICO|nr:16S rRNA (cytidine(1402)-2'-O)-methyltransferase [Brevibacterium yomogidense]SLM95127.1 rRNA small subunit methyltransferase I [Brevibacterium yomogidense]